MEARIVAVQKRLLFLLLVSLAVAVLARPRLDNGRYSAALEEMVSFHTTFSRDAAERTIRAQAEAQSPLSFEAVQTAVASQRAPKIKLAGDLAPLAPLTRVQLHSLADVQRHAQPGVSQPVATVSPEALGSALAWRLARSQKNGPFTLRQVQLLGADVRAEDVALEAEVAALRLRSLEARAAFDDATRKVAVAERRVEKRQKRKSRSLEKMQVARDEAQLRLTERSAAHEAAQLAYEAAAQRAEQPHTLTKDSGVRAQALARVTVELAGQRSTFDIPVQLVVQSVSIAPLPGISFAATQAAGLWDEVKDLTPDAATQAIRGHFNWHFNHVELLGLKLSGSKLLQLLPCVLPLLLGLLLLRMRRAETSYSPFSTRVPETLPRVGLPNRFLEFVALVVLPLLAIGSATASLLLIDQPPVLPILTAGACLPLGALTFAKLSELRAQTVSIVKSHSFPPPAL